MKTFTELKNAQAVVIAYDGFNPMPPTFCYLKPYYNDPNKSYFEQLAEGATLMNGFETILPFLKPIEHLILDDSISEVMVNGADCVFIEKRRLPRAGARAYPSATRALMVAVKNIARRLGNDISEAKPDSRFPPARWQPRRRRHSALQLARRHPDDPQVQHHAISRCKT